MVDYLWNLQKEMQKLIMEKKSDPSLLETHEAWSSFIASELSDTHEAYLRKPDFLLGHSGTERQTSADYAGRELLELVQNAADAAAESGVPGQVLIEVTLGGLFVANKGQPFRTGGVKSLMTAHTSDKPTRAAKMIGAKGLGFRAILNWTEAPVISSGALEIGFSRIHADAKVAALAKKNSKIRDLFSNAGEKTPPVLVFPATGQELEGLGDKEAIAMLKHIRALRKEGFDTVVAAPFRDKRAFKRAIEQASQFEPSFLLFVKALDGIRIRLPDEPERNWTKQIEDDDDVTLYLESGPDTGIQSWILRQQRGTLGNGKAEQDFELSIALRLDEECSPGRLHSYFPTSLPLPFSGLFHATLELDSNRKTIQEDSDLNEGVLAALGRFHAETLDELRQSGRLTGNPLSWLVSDVAFPQSLEMVATEAWSRARELPLIEGLDGVWRTANDSRIGPQGYTQFIPSRLFGEMAKVEEENIEKLLRDKMKVREVDPGKILKRLRKGNLDISERARAIVGIASALPEEHHDRRLFVDVDGKEMPKGAIPFPPPSKEEQRHSLPPWSTARFIHPDLWKQLENVASGDTQRERISSLKGFRVTEFSVDSVIGALRTKLAELLKSNHPDPNQIQSDFLAEIYSLFDNNRNRSPGLIRVRCQDDNWRDVTTVHLSEHYGQSGRINAALYKTHPELLMASPIQNGLPDDDSYLADFLIWLGINQWPRTIVEPLPSEWRPNIIQALPEKFTVSSGNTPQDLVRNQLSWGHTITAEHNVIERLDAILENAPSVAILAWISQDERFDPLAQVPAFSVSVKGRSSAYATFRDYKGGLPDIVRLSVQIKEWLACNDKLRHSPEDVMIRPGQFSVLFNTPEVPVFEQEMGFGLTQELWLRGLERAGVARGLADIPEAEVYRLLSSLPSRDVKPELASRLYLQLLERENFEPETGGSDRATFLNQGMVPVRSGEGCIWAKRQDAHYAHRDDLPEAVRPHLTLIDLPSRRNATQVERRFGIPALRKSNMNIRLLSIEVETGGLAERLLCRFGEALPFILALRHCLSPEEGPLRRLKDLELKVANRVEMELSINSQSVVEDLEPFKYNLQRRNLIITIDPDRYEDENFDLGLHAISDGLAELFELQANADFTSLLTASTPSLRESHLKRALPTISAEELKAALTGQGYVESSDFQVDVDVSTLKRGLEASENGKPTLPNELIEGFVSSQQEAESLCEIDDSVNNELGETQLKVTSRPLTGKRRQSSQGSESSTVRVGGATGQTSNRNSTDVNKAADAEKWTVTFEKSQNRFPMLVAALQGKGAYGCDCLSFATESDYKAFLEDPKKISLVARFIETKSGGVRFTENEWNKAKEMRERYFAYRVNFVLGQRDQAILTIVRNPSAHSSAIRVVHELFINQVESREEFDLTPIDEVNAENFFDN